MATILEFKQPDKTADKLDMDSLTKKEFDQRVTEETLFRCRALVNYYKITGQWTDESCERAMVEAVQALKKVCHILVENKDKNTDGKTETAS